MSPLPQILKKNRDSVTSITKLMSQAEVDGAAGTGLSKKPTMNTDGAILVFHSNAMNLVATPSSGENK